MKTRKFLIFVAMLGLCSCEKPGLVDFRDMWEGVYVGTDAFHSTSMVGENSIWDSILPDQITYVIKSNDSNRVFIKSWWGTLLTAVNEDGSFGYSAGTQYGYGRLYDTSVYWYHRGGGHGRALVFSLYSCKVSVNVPDSTRQAIINGGYTIWGQS